jgi:hypothetical protein
MAYALAVALEEGLAIFEVLLFLCVNRNEMANGGKICIEVDLV